MNNTVVIAGAQHPWECETSPSVSAEYAGLARLIRDNAIPVLAEPGSPLRYSDNAIPRYGLLLPFWQEKIGTVIVAGHPTLHRSVAQLISRADADIYIFEPEKAPWHEEGKNPGKRITSIDEAVSLKGRENRPGQLLQRSKRWLGSWQKADRSARELLQDVLAGNSGGKGGGGRHGLQAAQTIWEALKYRNKRDRGLDLRVFLGPSSPVRDFDLVMDNDSDTSSGPTVYTNRGLAGIDGLVATASGIALAPPREPYVRSETVVVLGDISFLHDVGGLFVGQGERQPSLTIIVFNDRGGSIFSRLEHGAVARRSPGDAQDVERYFSTPQRVGLSRIAQAYGVGYQRIGTMRQLTDILLGPSPSCRRIVEVPVDREGAHALYSDIGAAAEKIFAGRHI